MITLTLLAAVVIICAVLGLNGAAPGGAHFYLMGKNKPAFLSAGRRAR